MLAFTTLRFRIIFDGAALSWLKRGLCRSCRFSLVVPAVPPFAGFVLPRFLAPGKLPALFDRRAPDTY
jgi:hypothetical protein